MSMRPLLSLGTYTSYPNLDSVPAVNNSFTVPAFFLLSVKSVNLYLIISILLIIFLGRKENLFRVRKDIKKDKFEIKYIFSSIPLMLFILVCIIISLSQLRLV